MKKLNLRNLLADSNSIFIIFLFSILLGVSISSLTRISKPPIGKMPPKIDKILSDTIKNCQNKSNCYDSELEKITIKYDYTISFSVLDKHVRDKPEFSYCKFMAHAIGHGSFENEPKNGQKTRNK